MTVRWGSLISTPDGEIDYTRLTRLVALLLGLGGGTALILAMIGVLHPTEVVVLGTSATVVPITAGKITDALVARRAATTAEAADGGAP